MIIDGIEVLLKSKELDVMNQSFHRIRIVQGFKVVLLIKSIYIYIHIHTQNACATHYKMKKNFKIETGKCIYYCYKLYI